MSFFLNGARAHVCDRYPCCYCNKLSLPDILSASPQGLKIVQFLVNGARAHVCDNNFLLMNQDFWLSLGPSVIETVNLGENYFSDFYSIRK